MKYLSWLNLVWLVIYVLVMVGGLAALHWTRHWAISEFERSEKLEEWSEWREETARQASGEGPVLRRQAKSVEPPTLVLLRDYYFTCQAAFLLFGTVLFAVLMVLLRGALSTTKYPLTGDTTNPAEETSRDQHPQDTAAG